MEANAKNLNQFTAQGAPQPTVITGGAAGGPKRAELASYATYAEAQRAVDALSDEKFPVERTAIIGEGLKFVEQVTGRLNWGRALLNGAGSGALSGVFIGLIFSFFTVFADALILSLYGLLVGAVVGAVLSAVGYGLSGGKRDFTSVNQMKAERYKVMVDAELLSDAQAIVAKL